MTEHLEVEAKLRVSCDEHDRLRGRLKSLGARLVESKREEDTYYAHPCRDFAATDEALRVRRSGAETVITYKGPRLARGATKARLEIELRVDGDPGPLLERLGFSPVARVVKEREYYRLGEALVTLDTVESLGCFVEVEAPGPDRVQDVLEQLGVRGEPVEETYLELILRKLGTTG